MPRHPMTATQRKALSLRMKKRWRVWRKAKVKPLRTTRAKRVLHLGQPENGVVHVDTRIVLHVAEQEFVLSLGDARQLREALTEVLYTGEGHTEPTHE